MILFHYHTGLSILGKIHLVASPFFSSLLMPPEFGAMLISCREIVNIIPCWPWLCWFVSVMLSSALVVLARDTIFQGQEMRDWEFLTSSHKYFKLQFFSLGTSNSRYLGIFPIYGIRPVWIANRNSPIGDTSGTLIINGSDSMLYIRHSGGSVILPTISGTSHRSINTSVTLQDDGNLVLRQVHRNGSMSGTVLWESFDYPTDSLLPGMKLGINLKTGHQWSLTSWASDYGPSSGSLTLGMDMNSSSTNQLMIWWNKKVLWNSGPWLNGSFENLGPGYDGILTYTANENEKCFTYSTKDWRKRRGLSLADSGVLYWATLFVSINCDSSYEHRMSEGCANYSFPKCMKSGNYRYESKIEYAAVLHSYVEECSNLSLIDCKDKCVQNCSCYGYSSFYENGTGCRFWDRSSLTNPIMSSSGEPPYIRSDLDAMPKKRRIWQWYLIIIITTAGGIFALLIIGILCIRRKCKNKGTATPSRIQHFLPHQMSNEEEDSKMDRIHKFSFKTIETATNNFSDENKLGEGGFGSVYKGTLSNGQEIAVKKLSGSSHQGLCEFKNEIKLIVKLQHNNLVKLMGCCIHLQEMMLVYEYMPNKSLDSFLFDPVKRDLLNWRERMNIIEGIAQGMLYLHKHSRLRVIHRDLKASNILLDTNMIPKISDFGIARIFEVQDCEANTKRVMGTHGYMAPEYAIWGVVSTKIDVFSFGVLVMEIVSGKKNYKSYHSERPLNLIGWAWELWNQGKALDLVDSTMDVSGHLNEVQRCINVGLLCVQDSAIDRPSMLDVNFMLKNELLQLQIPKQPAFFIDSSRVDKYVEDSVENHMNKLSISIMEAREMYF